MLHEDRPPDTCCPASREEWRRWLEEHHDKKPSVWLIQYKKRLNVPTITWSEAVDEALCFGWIDSVRKSVDADRFMQFFGPRKPRSVWSKINKGKVEQLISQGRMTPAGHAAIETAKANGSWAVLDDVEALKIPKDLRLEFKSRPGSQIFFASLSRSVRKSMLQWLAMAKRPETRQKRISEIATLAAIGLKPKPF